MENTPLALSGIRVIDHTTALAGPYCAQMLGDLGADVIKIERVSEGDQSRKWGPPFVGTESAYFLGTNRNKRGMTLDLKQPQGKEILHKLIAQADVVIHNVPRESSRKKLGLDAETCLELNPKLIWASISGFGNTGPYAERAGYDVTVQGISGTMSATGEPGTPPMRFPTPIADITTGIYTTIAILAALYARHNTGKGQVIDNALLDSQVTWLANIASSHLATGDPVAKIGNAHPTIVPYQPFPTADGWIIVGAGNEKLWKSLIEVLQCPEIGSDPRFATNIDRLKHREEVSKLLAEYFQKETTDSWVKKLEAVRIPVGEINPVEKILKNDHLLARGMVVEFDHPTIGKIRSLGNPMHLSGTPVSYRLPPPTLGQHNEEILQELGYSQQQIQNLKEQQVI